MNVPASRAENLKVLGLCFLAAVFEGYDIQSAGVAAAALKTEYGLDPSQLGLVFSASIAGLLLGALFGGRISDHRGRKPVLVFSVGIFGIFSLLTPLAPDYAWLLVARLLAGVGLGGALPNMIAMASESGPLRSRVSRVVVMSAGLPLGAMGAAAVAVAVARGLDWRVLFAVGGLGPLALAPLLAKALPGGKPAGAAGAAPPSALSALFSREQRLSTALLWVAFFFTLLVLYLMLNWLPSLLQSKGLDRAAAARVSIMFNLGGVCGAVCFGVAIRDGVTRILAGILYLGMAAGLASLAIVSNQGLSVAAFVAGVFIISGQFVLYGLSPAVYPVAVRGTGVGAAVSVGRVGSVLGPMVAGLSLIEGGGANAVLIGAIPAIILAGAAVLAIRGVYRT